MVRIYDADDPDADLPLTRGEKDAEQEADRIRNARRWARREARGALGPNPIHSLPTPDDDTGTGPGTGVQGVGD